MTIRELIIELQKLDQDIPVCGQSETSTWDVLPRDLVPEEDVEIFRYPHEERCIYPKALILGYRH